MLARISLSLALVVVVVSAKFANHITLNNSHNHATSSSIVGASWDWLNKLLDGVVVKIPDTDFPEQDSIVFGIKNTVCSHFQIGSLDIALAAKHQLTLGVVDLQGVCNADWHFKDHAIPYVSGSGALTATIEHSTVTTAIGFDYNTLQLPSAARLDACSSDLSLTLKFSQSIVARILNLLRKRISEFLTKTLNDKLCDIVRPLVVSNVTKALQKLDSTLLPIVVTPTPTPTPKLPANAIIWNSFAPLQQLQALIRKFLTATQVNSLVHKLTKGTGAIVLPVNVNASLDTPLAVFSIATQSVNASHLDSLTQLLLLETTTTSVDLLNEVALQTLNLTVDTLLALDSKVNPGQHLANNVSFGLLLHGLDLGVDLTVAVYADFKDRLFALRLPQVGSRPCVVQSVVGAAFASHVALSYNNTPDFEVGGYDPDFDKFIEGLLAIGYNLFDGALPVIEENLSDGPIKQIINNQIASLMEGECLPPPPPSQSEVDLRTFEPLQLLHMLLNTLGRFVLSQAHNGTILIPGVLFSGNILDDVAGTLALTVRDVNISGFETFDNVTVLQTSPKNPYMLYTNISVGSLSVALKADIKFTDRKTGVVTMSNTSLEIGVLGVRIVAVVGVQLNADAFAAMTLGQAVVLSNLLTLIDDLEIGDISFKIANITHRFENTSSHQQRTSDSTDKIVGASEDSDEISSAGVIENNGEGWFVNKVQQEYDQEPQHSTVQVGSFSADHKFTAEELYQVFEDVWDHLAQMTFSA